MVAKSRALGCIVVGFLLLSGCASRALTKAGVREALLKGPGIELKKNEVEIEEVSESGQHAIVKARLHTALKYEKVGNQWVLKEVRLGDRHWESLDVLVKALNQERAERARLMLNEISAAMEKYRQARGQYPNVPSYEALIDQLAPQYLPEIIRLDPWSRPFQYQYLSPSSYRLWSNGADGKPGTADDIAITK